jgi:hypothetical protein
VSGVIQSRESMSSVAMAAEMKCRKCPQNEVTPNQTTPRGLCFPRVKRPPRGGRGGSGRNAGAVGGTGWFNA